MKKTEKPAQETGSSWYRTDNAANVYAAIRTGSYSAIFRYSVFMTAEVKPEVLQEALDITMKRFGVFDVCIKRGLFWYYLEPNGRPGPFIKKDVSNPCMPVRYKEDNGYLLRVFYYERCISLEMYHVLSDGAGAAVFLKTLLAVYLRLQGYAIPDTCGIADVKETTDPEEGEDAYRKYASAAARRGIKARKAYRISGTLCPFYTMNVITGVVPLDELRRVSREYKATVTEYLGAVLLDVLLKKQEGENRISLYPVSINVPIDLRRFFPTKTLRNFFLTIRPEIDPLMGEYTFDEILGQIHHYMRLYVNKNYLRARLTGDVRLANNIFTSLIPLFLKNWIITYNYKRLGDRQNTATFTNPGIFNVPEEMRPHIVRVEALLGQPYSPHPNCACVSCGNIMAIKFGSCIKETDVEREFFKRLVADGIHVKIESNRDID